MNCLLTLKKLSAAVAAALFCICGLAGETVYAQYETETAGSSLKIEQGPEVMMPKGVAGWSYNNGGARYYDKDGTLVTSAWRKIDGNWCYFNSNGFYVNNDACELGTIKGIDVSKWQADIDWKDVKEDGFEFAFIRVGYNDQQLDPKFEDNIKGANAVGLPAGVYYYSKAQNEAEAVEDAKFVLEQIEGHTISYPVAYDMEDSSQKHLSKSEISAIINAFCDEIRAAGYTPMLYANENWCKDEIAMDELGDIELWIARYNYYFNKDIKRDIWQSTSKGRVDGIEGDVDINFGFVDYTKVIKPRTEAKKVPFVDVHEDDWYYDSICQIYDKNLISGLNEYEFAPSEEMSRAMVATILWRFAGCSDGGTQKFPDVPNNSWCTKAISWNVYAGIVKGYENGNFGPDDFVTREQIAVFLYRFAKLANLSSVKDFKSDLSLYEDEQNVSSWARDAIGWANSLGIIQGEEHSDGYYLRPLDHASRAEACAMIMRFVEYRESLKVK